MMTYASTPNTRQTTRGFTLVEVSISMVVVGLILTIGTLMIPRIAFQYQEQATYDRMDRIHKAISAYAQKHNRVPCPADPDVTILTQPYGTERGSGAAGTAQGSCPTLASRQGIIPFRTLGLTLDDIEDSFGNFITYKVSATSSQIRNPATDFINNWCRTQPVWHNGVNDIDPEKAAFCCTALQANNIAEVDQDLQIEGPFGPLPRSSRAPATSVNYGGSIGEYSRTTSPVPAAATLQNTFRPSIPAYVLISHGANGIGSYRDNGLQKPGRWRSNHERFNSLNTTRRVFVQDNSSYMPSAADPGIGTKQRLYRSRLDDIVSWMTPAQTYAYTGNASCMEPR